MNKIKTILPQRRVVYRKWYKQLALDVVQYKWEVIAGFLVGLILAPVFAQWFSTIKK